MNKIRYRLSKTIIKRGTKDSFIDTIAITGNFATVNIKGYGPYDCVLSSSVKDALLKAQADQLAEIYNKNLRGTVKRDAVI
jgi:hypothetical protein